MHGATVVQLQMSFAKNVGLHDAGRASSLRSFAGRNRPEPRSSSMQKSALSSATTTRWASSNAPRTAPRPKAGCRGHSRAAREATIKGLRRRVPPAFQQATKKPRVPAPSVSALACPNRLPTPNQRPTTWSPNKPRVKPQLH